MAATAAASVVNGGASAIGYEIVSRFLAGNFNPDFKKEARKQMRYIQQKYSLAYGGGLSGEDPCAIIQKIDPLSKIMMTPDGKRPANPFPDERAFEDSLQMNFHPVSGHQGRFVASHAMAAIGVAIDYQNARKARMWVPGVINPGRPNDYINLFLEESKTWLRNQLTLDTVHADELQKRADYYAKLKNDNYYWCFPVEAENCNIHKVIDFIHERVQNAYEIVSREEKNKSLQTLFKELNDHTTNIFEFGKLFLAYLLCTNTKAGANLLNSNTFDGKSYETGKLHKLLDQATELVFKSYVQDMEQTDARLNAAKQQAVLNNARIESISGKMGSNALLLTNSANESKEVESGVVMSSFNSASNYIVNISEYEEPSALNLISGAVYVIEICDPKGYAWNIRKSYSELEAFHNKLSKDETVSKRKAKINDTEIDYLEYLAFPSNVVSVLSRKKSHYDTMCDSLRDYLLRVLSNMHDHSPSTKSLICSLIDVKHLIITEAKALHHAEAVPNLFVSLRDEFKSQLVAKINTENQKQDNMSKNMQMFKSNWGIEWVIKIFEAYSLLQRMASILGWTLEINHFFISMFGNTLSFSKLPLRNIIMTQKDIMSNFLVVVTDLYTYACKLNCESQYKWHKNLQITEHELGRIKFHVEQALNVINVIDAEHLDYEAQMRRLEDVHARFQPLMNRVDVNLISIQDELGLPRHEMNTVRNIGTRFHTTDSRGEEKKPVDDVKQIEWSNDKQYDNRQLKIKDDHMNVDTKADQKFYSPKVEELPSDVEINSVIVTVDRAQISGSEAKTEAGNNESKHEVNGANESQVCLIC